MNEEHVTVLLFSTFLSANVHVAPPVTVSPDTTPEYVMVQLAFLFPSYVLLLQLGVLAVSAFGVIFAVVVLLPDGNE